MQPDLFGNDKSQPELPDGAMLLRGFAKPIFADLYRELNTILAAAPLRNMKTPGGHTMSVAMTNCGALGWVSDTSGYRYVLQDPATQLAWPLMPEAFLSLASGAAAKAGYPQFSPDACLINQYLPGTKLSLHQDKNETDFAHPIVSVSLGLPATFQFGGSSWRDPVQLIEMVHNDILVWGGPSRLFYHGVRTVKKGVHDDLGARRINLTFRKAH